MSAMLQSIALAFQLLTRLPMPRGILYSQEAMAASAAWFPLVGLVVGGCAIAAHALLRLHAPTPLAAVAVLLVTVLVTGALHEDGLADAADAFGAGGTRERMLGILKDSRIGTYGAIALTGSLGTRWLLLAYLPQQRFAAYVLCAHVLCRWTTLPLAAWLPSAREAGSGQGSQFAGRMQNGTLLAGSLFALLIATTLLHRHAVAPVLAAMLVALLTGLYYRRRLGGVTGDCFGATNQLAEIAVLLCGVLY